MNNHPALDTQPEFANSLKKNTLVTAILLATTISNASADNPQVAFGSYTSIQVNVDAFGRNIVNDMANEPSIAVNPTNPGNMVIGWRRFYVPVTSLSSPQGGYAYTQNKGLSWINGVHPNSPPITKRTDPSLDVDSQGNFYYQSLASGATSVDETSVFKSSDGGATWQGPVYQFNGDKNWIAVDRTGGTGDGHIYSTWRGDLTENPKYFVRSIDQGLSYAMPDEKLPVLIGFSRIAIGPNGEVYLSGRSETPMDFGDDPSPGVIMDDFYFLKSTNASDPNDSPLFSAKSVDFGGYAATSLSGTSPNPLGALGDVQIGADQSSGPLQGNIYMLANPVLPGWQSGDKMDIHFIHSSDGGETWSAPLRINDDPPSRGSLQWFPMLGVAPNSRIDAVWYDTRNGTGSKPHRISQLYYSYSWDGGLTWSPNRPVTPAFNTHQPYLATSGAAELQQYKMGDYTHLVSDANGAHIAYTATYNGEQDVYYLNVFPDCNSNAVSDVIDLRQRLSGDINANHTPDSCENINVPGDIDGDRDVDQLDVNLVLAAKNKPASGSDDPRDLDHNGIINLLDSRKQALLCTRPRCAESGT
ncbi:MAG: hypothetical protein PHH11_12510 [Methylomonas sp.]|nr:hypothetical protein [Methylomonas sp.]